MDIVYIIGKGSKKANLELRMSLRSIGKYGCGIGRVIVAGYPPAWLTKEVLTYPIEDRYEHKHLNILHCIETIVEEGLVKGEFLYSSDDHFYVKSTDFDTYPVFIKGQLRERVIESDPFYEYHKSLVDTRDFCQKHGLGTANFSQHCNTHMHSEIIKQMKPILKESYMYKYGVEPTSVIMNGWLKENPNIKVLPRKDIKITKAKTTEEIYRLIGDRDCFSIGDAVFKHHGIYDFFLEEYSIPTIFEKPIPKKK